MTSTAFLIPTYEIAGKVGHPHRPLVSTALVRSAIRVVIALNRPLIAADSPTVEPLSERDAEIIRRFQNGEDPDEIGRAMGLAERWVLVALYRLGELHLEELGRWIRSLVKT